MSDITLTEADFDHPLRDETPAEMTEPDYWLVWDDADYYGPDLRAVCRTREEAVTWAIWWVTSERSSSRWGDLYLAGDMWDVPGTA